jgi:His/Glu/Gln/Arg/opine family amino acid ABC transporter permease subunit
MWDWGYALEVLPELAKAAVITIEATFLGFALAAVLGLVFAILRMSRNPWIANSTTGLVEFVRGTPVLIQLFFMFYVLPRFGITMPAMLTGVLALGLHYATYCSEVYRAGLDNIPPAPRSISPPIGPSRTSSSHRRSRRSRRRSATTSSPCSRRRHCSRRSPSSS